MRVPPVRGSRDPRHWNKHGNGIANSVLLLFAKVSVFIMVFVCFQYTPAVDMWSVGVILYILLSVRQLTFYVSLLPANVSVGK